MVITLDKLRQMLAEIEKLFPAPDPGAKAEDSIGCFEGIVPEGKTGVELIKDERNREFGAGDKEDDE